MAETKGGVADRTASRLPATALAALGVVFGDIGTSPLYTLKTVLALTGARPDPSVTSPTFSPWQLLS
jgi:K+ transporter